MKLGDGCLISKVPFLFRNIVSKVVWVQSHSNGLVWKYIHIYRIRVHVLHVHVHAHVHIRVLLPYMVQALPRARPSTRPGQSAPLQLLHVYIVMDMYNVCMHSGDRERERALQSCDNLGWKMIRRIHFPYFKAPT